MFNYPNEDAVVHSAKKFEAYIKNLLSYIRDLSTDKAKVCFYESRADFEAQNHKINIVGHSMGGLVARYYIENMSYMPSQLVGGSVYSKEIGYDKHVDKLITICTPHWGSDLANTSCKVGDWYDGLHVLCDHDLRTDSAMYGGDFGVDLDCLASLGIAECYDEDYTLTDELQYNENRLTRYYAITGITFDSNELIDNNIPLELQNNHTTYSSLNNEIRESTLNKLYTWEYIDGMAFQHPINVFDIGDNVVEFLSQIGWTSNLFSDSPDKIIDFEKIFINIDTDGGNSIIDRFHSKMPQREEVADKVIEYLTE